MGHVASFLCSCTQLKSAAGKSLPDLRSFPSSPCPFLFLFVHPSKLNTELCLSHRCVARTLTCASGCARALCRRRKGWCLPPDHFLGPICFSHFFDSWKQHRSGEGG